MALGTFTPPASVNGSSFDPRDKHGRPLIVVPRKFLPQHVSKRFPTPRDKVAVDVVDLLENQVYLSVLWGSGPIVDRLNDAMKKGNTDVALPIKIEEVKPESGGNKYYIVVPLEGKELQLAAAWDEKNPGRVDRERAEAEAEAGQQQQNGAGNESPATEAPAAPAAAAQPRMDDDALEAAIAAL